MMSRGTISLVFDDGYKDVYEHVLPLLKKYNIPGVFAVPLKPDQALIEGAVVQSVNDWNTVAAHSCHEIAAHGVSHKNLATMPAKDCDQELRQSHEATSATTLVYPGGAYTHEVQDIAKKYFSAARTVRFGLETIPPRHPYELKTINYTKKNFSVARANIYAMKAWVQHAWLIETFHMVRPMHSKMKHFTFLDDLDAHLNFITSLPIQIKTIREVIS